MAGQVRVRRSYCVLTRTNHYVAFCSTGRHGAQTDGSACTRVLGLVGVGHRAGRPLSAPLGPGYGGGARAAEASLGPIDSLEQGTPARTVRGTHRSILGPMGSNGTFGP